MLNKLSITNYALIESLEMDMSSGFSVVTGETGSGKSIFLGALQLIIGERADLKVLFDVQKKCVIEAFFNSTKSINQTLASADLDVYEDLIIRREIHPSGKSRAFVNDSPVKLDFLKKLGLLLIDFHGQHQNRLIAQPDYQYSFIDSIGKNQLLLNDYKLVYDRYIKQSKLLYQVIEKEKSINNQREFLSFQLDELNKFSFEKWDEQQINEEHEMLSNFENVQQLFKEISFFNNSDNSLLVQLNSLRDLLAKLVKNLPALDDFNERLDGIYLELNELFIDLDKRAPAQDFDPFRMEELNEQLQLINKLNKKFNTSSLEGLILKKKDLQENLSSITSLSEQKFELENQVKKLYDQCLVKGDLLFEARKKNNTSIEKYLSQKLDKLSMPNVSIRIELENTKTPQSYGVDQLKFFISINKGSSYNEIADVASGGEIARILLAMKSLLNKQNTIPTIIFDEIDTGVSGKVANEVGQLLKELSKNTQVLTITHLPQVASMGNHHFKVSKAENKLRAYTEIKKLSKEDRILEIASMLGGAKPGKAAFDNAAELLN